MASTFSFGFSGDDIDMDVDNDIEVETGNNVSEKPNTKDTTTPTTSFPAVKHALKDWVRTFPLLFAGCITDDPQTTNLPSQMSYNTLKLGLSQPTTTTTTKDETTSKAITISRRELFDIRTQLMAEDDADDLATDNAELIAGLEQGDLKPNFYEGGFKTWECSLDLADVLLGSADKFPSMVEDGEGVHVIELGCGTAVPSLMLFARILLSTTSSSSSIDSQRRYRFTMADYNSTVLRMVTFSNFLLTWWINSSASPRGVTTTDEGGENGKEVEVEGELDIDAVLLETFQTDLERRGIEIEFISGGWSAEFVRLALDSDASQQDAMNPSSTLVLASETIYSPSSLGVFSETLLELLRKTGSEDSTKRSTALIAAKKVYFGVGGGVDEFLQVLNQQPLQDKETVRVDERREITSGGVKRVVLEIAIDKK
ncbi:Histidine protein methyltransferase 1 [Talaromyces pinophilus]|nr:Histidine protein methyltransferase 1 [Talaromyces pinophilus]